jgi:predicted AAA+ superfamily ATPase
VKGGRLFAFDGLGGSGVAWGKEHDMEEMTAEQAREWGKTLSFESTWATITKLGERMDKTQVRVDETWAVIKLTTENVNRMSENVDRTTEDVKKMAEKVDRVTVNVGGLNRSIGELIETLIAARLWEKFAGYPYHLERACQRIPIYNEQNETKTDIDILLSDTEWCMAVEVKREADNKDVDKHLKRMELIRKYPLRK